MKKGGVLFIIALIVLNFLVLTFVSAQDLPPGMPSQLGQSPEETIEKVKNITETKWDYLGKEWRNIMLKNNFVSAMDGFFNKISPVFLVLFGESYSLSLALFVIIILWLIVFVESSRIIKSWGVAKGSYAYIIGLAFAVILAQIKFFNIIVNAAGRLIFSRESKWTSFLLGFVFFLVLFLIVGVSEVLAKYLEDKRKKLVEKTTQVKQKAIQKWFDAFSKR